MLTTDRIAVFGEAITETDETKPPSDPLVLEEHETTDAFPMSDRDVEFLESLDADPKPITVEFTRDGDVRLSTAQHVGVVTLPSGFQIEVTPKQTVTNVLWALQFALDVDAQMIETPTGFTQDNTFIDALGALYASALEDVLSHGLHREYVRRQETASQVRGRIDLTRQLQRSAPVPTDFEIEYDAHTADSLLNRGILAATRRLLTLVNNADIADRLDYHRQRLRQYVSETVVTAVELEQVDLTRLNRHYETALSLARIVLAEEFFEDLTSGEHQSFALFINMNSIFEAMVERAFREACGRLDGNWSVDGQASIPNLIDGPHAVSMTPDVVVRNRDAGSCLVADAKWKTGSPSAGDVYQLTSYILALEAPGVIVYPGQADRVSARSIVNGEYPLQSVELPTAASANSYEDYCEEIIGAAEGFLSVVRT